MDKDAFGNNTDWETISVEGDIPLPQQEPGGAQSIESLGSVPDMLQSPHSEPAFSENADSELQMNSESHNNHSHGSGDVGEHSHPELVTDDLSDEEPQHFKDLSEIYQNTEEVELADSDVEALLAESEEPTCYKEAAENLDWM